MTDTVQQMEMAMEAEESDSDDGAIHENQNEQELELDFRKNLKLFVITWIARIIPVFAAHAAVIYIIYLFANPANWSTDSSSTDAEILARESNRGVLVSILIAILMNIIGAFMFYIKVRESLVVTNYGFILGPVVGFMLDQGIATDAGFKHFFTAIGFSHTFASLIGGNFMRYIVTVFLDLFISNPLQDVLKNQVSKVGVIKVLKYQKNKRPFLLKYDSFVALNFPSILQSIVGFVTFNAYTNQTRFAWAYPAATLDRELRIPPGTMMLSTAIAGVLYLNFYTIMDYISEREYFDVNTKLLYVLAILGLLYGLNQTSSIEAPVDGELDKVWTEPLGASKPILGFLMFVGFVCYGFVYPVYTRMGCCGKCKPKESEQEVTDHVAEIDDDPTRKEREMIEKIKRQITEELMSENINK